MRLADGRDLDTTRRIISAAIDLFAADGYAGTSVRSVATAAGVSPGLVIQRFGDKAGLRAACDDAVLAEIMVRKRDQVDRSGLEPSAFGELRRSPEMVRLIDYLTQMVLDRSTGGDHLFDAIVQRSRESLDGSTPGVRARPGDDPEALAVLVAAHSLVEVIWRHQFARLLGSPDDPEGTVRLAGPTLQLYTEGVVDIDPPADRGSDPRA